MGHAHSGHGPSFCLLSSRPLHDRAEPGEKDVVLRFIPDGGDLFDPGLLRGLEDRLAGAGRRVGVEGAVADLRLLERSRLGGADQRAHGCLRKGQRASSQNGGGKQTHRNQAIDLHHTSFFCPAHTGKVDNPAEGQRAGSNAVFFSSWT